VCNPVKQPGTQVRIGGRQTVTVTGRSMKRLDLMQLHGSLLFLPAMAGQRN
jgi:hypothetical protein